MTKRQHLRERPHKEEYFAAADMTESASLSLREMLDRYDSEVRGDEMAFGPSASAEGRWETAVEGSAQTRPGR